MKKVILIFLLTIFCFNFAAYANPIDTVTDNVSDKVSDKINTTIDTQTDKLTTSIANKIDLGFNLIIHKILAVIWWVTEVLLIIGVGWIMSFMCDRDSRTMVKFLVVLSVISLTVDKLISLVR